jgi:uncharacterized tellurite resistance protein B-like protein
MSDGGHDHTARNLPEDQRLEYLVAVASMVCADGQVAESELEVVRTLCEALAVSAETAKNVLAAARHPDRARVDATASRLRGHPLRYALLTDAILVAFADGKVLPGESEEIAELADALGISRAHAGLIGRYVETVIVGEEHPALSKALSDQLAEHASHVHPPRGVRWLYRKLIERR